MRDETLRLKMEKGETKPLLDLLDISPCIKYLVVTNHHLMMMHLHKYHEYHVQAFTTQGFVRFV